MPNNNQCPEGHYPYTIKPGDTLNYIARRLEVNLQRILIANPGLNPYNLRIGQIICIPACPPNHIAVIIQSGDTLYKISQTYQVSTASIIEANPSIDPNYLRIGQRICIPRTCPPDYWETAQAMQMDIDILKEESDVHQTHESNYGDSTQTTRAIKVTRSQLQFDAAPVVFSGNYRRRYTENQSYPYYSDSAAGGQRGINVKDNFGIWHSFGYRVPLPQ